MPTTTNRRQPTKAPRTRSRSTSSRRAAKLEPGTLRHFAEFCRRFLVLDNGHPLDLEPFQRRLLADYFDGVRETVVILGKGNGKTTLFAALALYHLCYTSDADCVVAASSRDQATLLYNHARGFVERTNARGELRAGAAALQTRVVVKKGTREIRSLRDNGMIRVLASDTDHADGVGPTLALVDELHRHKNGDLYGVFHDGLGKRNGQIVTISTAGEDEESPLGAIRKRALGFPTVKRKGAYTVARSPSFVLHEWSLRPDENREDLRLVKRANPASFVTEAWLRERRESPTMTPTRWARYACGVWVRGEDAAISPLDWGRCADPQLDLPDGTPVWIGLDLGWKWDTTAIVPLHAAPASAALTRDGTSGTPTFEVGEPAIVEPPRDGTSTDEADIIEPLLEMRDRWKVLGVVFDRNAGGQQLAQRLERDHGMTVIDHSQDPAPMAQAAERLHEAVRTRALRHPAHERLTAHVLSAVAKRTTGEKWRLVKARRPIDGAIALAMAINVAAGELDRPRPAFERLA